MRMPARFPALALLATVVCAAGCGSDNTDIVLPGTTTPTAGVRTATPARTSTPVAGATTTPTTVAATPTDTTAGNPTPTATPGGVSQSVATVTGDLLPFFTIGAGLTVGVGSSALTAGSAVTSANRIIAAAADKNDPCPDGGTRIETDVVLPPTRTITLNACKVSDPQLGAFQFDGTITISFAGGTIAFDFDATDLSDNHVVMFQGSLNGTVQGGGFVLDGGPIIVSTPQGNFTLTLNDITIDSNHHLVSGSGQATDDNDNFDLASVNLTVNSGGLTADGLATFDDNSTATFLLNLQTGELTPT